MLDLLLEAIQAGRLQRWITTLKGVTVAGDAQVEWCASGSSTGIAPVRGWPSRAHSDVVLFSEAVA